MWDAAKAAVMEKFLGLNAYVRKERKTPISNLRFTLKGEKRNKVKSNQAVERK